MIVHDDMDANRKTSDDSTAIVKPGGRKSCFQEGSRDRPIVIDNATATSKPGKRKACSQEGSQDRPIVIEDSVVPQQGMAFSQEPLCKKHRTDEVAAQPTLSSPSLRSLSFQQLSHYDDILTDVLVDRIYYREAVRKYCGIYHSTFEDLQSVISILRDSVIIGKDLARAECQLLVLPGLKGFLDNLKSEAEKNDFRQHMKRYLRLYLPDCAFEILGTNRYAVTTHEAMVVSRKTIRKGEEIKYLSGIRVILTEDEADDLNERGIGFSVIETTRNEATSLLAGPVRFANHDCDANARLISTGTSGMQVIATRDIRIGEEIAVNYGNSYFGEDNCDCLCKTCEDHCQNGWKPEDQVDYNRSPKGSTEIERKETFDDVLEPTSSCQSTSKRRGEHSRSLRASRARTAHERRNVRMNHDPIGEPRPNRVPGDYLASQSGSVPWAHFGSCLEVTECVDEASTHPCVICERHRDLYGYQWPKTKKRSRYDSEERVYSGTCSNGTLRGVAKGEGDREVAPGVDGPIT